MTILTIWSDNTHLHLHSILSIHGWTCKQSWYQLKWALVKSTSSAKELLFCSFLTGVLDIAGRGRVAGQFSFFLFPPPPDVIWPIWFLLQCDSFPCPHNRFYVKTRCKWVVYSLSHLLIPLFFSLSGGSMARKGRGRTANVRWRVWLVSNWWMVFWDYQTQVQSGG